MTRAEFAPHNCALQSEARFAVLQKYTFGDIRGDGYRERETSRARTLVASNNILRQD